MYELLTQVPIRQGVVGDIIQFYNEVFLEAAASYILNVVSRGSEEPTKQRVLDCLWTDDQLQHWLAAHQLTTQDPRPPNTRAKDVYTFGQDASYKLYRITAKLNALERSRLMI
jgi:hypothetical protein